jgi:hypothetical protein
VLKYPHGAKNWDSLFTNPIFEFYFKVMIPGPNKERIILGRDKFGRILRSKTVEILNPLV